MLTNNIILALFFLLGILLAGLLYQELQRTFWVITIDEVYDYESFNHAPEIFRSRKAAERRLRDISKEARKEYGDKWLDSSDLPSGVVEFHLDGEYSCNHYSAVLQDVEAL